MRLRFVMEMNARGDGVNRTLTLDRDEMAELQVYTSVELTPALHMWFGFGVDMFYGCLLVFVCVHEHDDGIK